MNLYLRRYLDRSNKKQYPFFIKTLPEEDGGGFFIEYPDLPGCFSDGETVEEAMHNGEDAVKSWVETAKEDGDAIPEPYSYRNFEKFSGKFQQRLPKSLHKELAERAQKEGVSINQLVTSYVARGLGHFPVKRQKEHG